MSYQIELGNFDPDEDFVDIAGNFNSWGDDLTKLSDPDGDEIYSVTLDGFENGQQLEYKFRMNGRWDGTEEFPGTGNNRTFTVNKLEHNITVWYSDETPPTGPPEAAFTVNVRNGKTGDIIAFRNQSTGNITDFSWELQGAAPGISNANSPSVIYREPGTYDVQLIARDSVDNEADTLLQKDYITISKAESSAPPESPDEWWNERVFYEVFVRSFHDSDGDGIGDFKGLTQKLDYLNDGDPTTDDDLGITGIWLMPINNSPSYHGYDVTDYRSINPDYGTMQDFREFLDAAHERGIAVIIDFVMNHSSSQHPWFQASSSGDPEFRDYYRWRSTNPNQTGPWGQNVWHSDGSDFYYGLFWSGMPDLNYDTQAVKDSMFAAASFWLEEIGVDGFRLDAVLYLDEDGEKLKNTPENFEFWEDFTRHIKSVKPDAFSVGEAWDATSIVKKYVTNDRLDFAFEFDLAQTIWGNVASGNAGSILAKAQDVYETYPRNQVGTFLTNHDQNRIIDELNGNINQNKSAAAIYLTLPGVPFLYYGEEIGMSGTKPDRDIRRPMQWNDKSNAGFTNASQPWHNLNDNFRSFNVADAKADSASLFNLYRRIIHLRNDHEELQTGALHSTLADNESVLSYVRSDGQSSKLIVSNLSDNSVEDISIFPGNEAFVLSGSDPTDLVTGNPIEASAGSGESTVLEDLSLQPYQTVILDVEQQTGVSNEDGAGERSDIPKKIELDQNYPNPFNPSTTIQFQLNSATNVTLDIYNAIGQHVKTLVDQRMSAGSHQVLFEAGDLSSGIYLYRLAAQSLQITRKMVLVK